MSAKRPVNIEIERINRSRIYHHFLNSESLTRQQLVASTQLCLPTVTKNIETLLSEGLIFKSGSQGHTGGRRAATYSLVPDARVALGIDLTRNHVTVVAVDLTGTIIASVRNRVPYRKEESFYCYVGDLLSELIRSTSLKDEQILGVGIGLPALVDSDRRHIFFSKIIDLDDALTDCFARYIPYPILLFNDANAAAFTEIWKTPDIRNSFYLMLSNNVGGSMVISKKVYSGDQQRSGEVGHMTLVPGGRPCYCGQTGCADAYLAATNLSDLTSGNLQLFFDRLASGDPVLAKIWDEYLNDLARTVNNVHALLDCKIILGGYMGEYLQPYLSELRQRASGLDTFCGDGDYLQICSYRKESIAAGAALNLISAFISSV
ncbi:MAG: ROK family protein [Lachnospiraceae bacterium]|nr:ROK family protein [Lachnospiraceae bacterium]